jgi:peptide/nickel transport system permease protein
MLTFIARRLLQAIPVLIIASLVIFLMIHMIPGDPALTLAGQDADPEQVAAIREAMGLNRPLPVQYGTWMLNMLRGNMGKSLISKMPVSTLIGFAFPATILLTLAVVFTAIVVGIPFGVFLARKNKTPLDMSATAVLGVILAIPNFWLGIILILVFSVRLGIAPSSGYVPFFTNPIQSIRFLILPVIALGARLTAEITRFAKNSVLDTFKEDFVRTAKAKGLPVNKILFKHVLRNALVPIVAMVGTRFGRLLGGTVIVETVFAWPGLGRVIVQAVAARDYPLVQGGLLILIVMYILVNLSTDLLYGVIDPRISVEAKS